MLRSKVVLVACLVAPVAGLAAPDDQVHALRRDIAALQLDHALNLTPQQAQALLPLLQGARATVQERKAQWAASQPALVAALTQAVADLKANGTVSDATRQAVVSARGGSPGAPRRDMASFWQGAKQILTAEQLQALEPAPLGFRPAASAGDAGWGARGHHQGARFRLMHTLVSDSFVALVQARAG